MDGKFFSVFLATLLSILTQTSSWGQSYRGAVVEYQPVIGINQLDTMTKNTKNFIQFIEEASRKGVEIIVFPEYGLFSDIDSPIPDPAYKIVPCTSDFKTTQAVKDLSCASRDNHIYSVVNLRESRKCEVNDPKCPRTGNFQFNTNVVFDRTGAVIARYAKYNLFATDTANQPAEPEIVFFDTDFGVRFGTFICFDILFPFPAQRLVQQYGITDFVFSTFWFSELPFLTALQAQRGWAEANNVNLLASGINMPLRGSAGSGIYNGKFGHLVEIMPEKSTSKLLVADIPKLKVSEYFPLQPHSYKSYNISYFSIEQNPSSEEGFKLLRDPLLSNYTSEVIKGENFEKTICGANDFCCEFKVTMKALKPESKNYTYRAMVFNGCRPFGEKFRGGAQFCQIVACNGPELKHCGNRERELSGLFKFTEVFVKGKFKWRNSFQMPSTLTDGGELKPIPAYKYNFATEKIDKSIEASLELLWPVTDIYTFGIWGRDFARDNEPLENSANSAVSAPILFLTFILFFMFVR